MKKIIMIKSVFDDTEAQELEESFNPITVALTDAFLTRLIHLVVSYGKKFQ